MAAPTVVGAGAVDSLTAWAPTVAGTVLADDIIVLLVEQVGGETAPAATGYAHVTGSPVVQTTNTQLSVMWKRAVGGETAVTVTGPSNHAVTRTITIRGCKTVGNPWNVVQVASSATSSTGATWPGATTTDPDCLVLECIATGTDTASTTELGALTNAAYTSITEQMDNWASTGTGGGIGLNTGIKATAGATGASTATLTTAATKAYATLALAPAPPSADPPGLLNRSPRPSEQAQVAGPYALNNPTILLGG